MVRPVEGKLRDFKDWHGFKKCPPPTFDTKVTATYPAMKLWVREKGWNSGDIIDYNKNTSIYITLNVILDTKARIFSSYTFFDL